MLLVAVSAAVALEGSAALLLRTGTIESSLPTYSPSTTHADRFWGDLSPEFGTWHHPNATYRHRTSCFDVVYETNSAGARDRERSVDGPERRVVVLGDSFVEGYGVATSARWTDLLEADSGVEHLNFGTSGFFGPTQYLLLYRALASRYRHDQVLVGLLPANDFDEDDLEFGRRYFADRYRPYFVGADPDYRLTYFRERLELPPTGAADDSRADGVRHLLRETTHLFHLVRTVRSSLAFRTPTPGSVSESRYYSFDARELTRLGFVLGEIVRAAQGRRLTVVVMPIRRDVELYRERGAAPLSAALDRIGRERGFEVVDLLPAFARRVGDPAELFHRCDGHWNEIGHRAASEALVERARGVTSRETIGGTSARRFDLTSTNRERAVVEVARPGSNRARRPQLRNGPRSSGGTSAVVGADRMTGVPLEVSPRAAATAE